MQVIQMYDITENVTLEMENVLSFRGKVTQQQINEIAKEIERMIRENAAQKNGASVSVTFAVDRSGSEPLIDIEFLTPLNKRFDVRRPYQFKPKFRLKNAVKIRHAGSPATLQNAANELMRYISEHGFTPVTAGYNVTVREPKDAADINNMIVDIYIGVNDNIL